MKKNIFGIPIDIIVDILQFVVEVVKLLTPNQKSKYQTTKTEKK